MRSAAEHEFDSKSNNLARAKKLKLEVQKYRGNIPATLSGGEIFQEKMKTEKLGRCKSPHSFDSIYYKEVERPMEQNTLPTTTPIIASPAIEPHYKFISSFSFIDKSTKVPFERCVVWSIITTASRT